MDWNQLLNNPQLQAMMNNPQFQNMLQDPQVQAMMNNPEMLQSMMSDPSVQAMLGNLQGGGGAGAGFPGVGGMGCMGGMGGMGAAAGASNPNIVNIQSSAEFDQLIKGSKPVVVDFWATWCGPCKRIAPVFEELANSHHADIVFAKVDGDRVRDLCAAKGIRGFPTFQFYSGGSLQDSFSGADENRLRNEVSKLAAAAEQASQDKPSPFKNFPILPEEAVTYLKIKFEPVMEKIKTTTEEFAANEALKPLALTEKELHALDRLKGILSKPYLYHQNSGIAAEDVDVVVKRLLQWPRNFVTPGLHLIRILTQHPVAVQHLRPQTKDIVKLLCDRALKADKPTTALLAFRALANFHSRRALVPECVSEFETVVGACEHFLMKADTEADLAKACMAVLINLSVFLNQKQGENSRRSPQHQQQQQQQPQGDLEALAYEARVFAANSIVQTLGGAEHLSPELQFQLCCVLGTLVFRNPEVIEIVEALEADAVLKRIVADQAGQPAGACAAELLWALAKPEL